MEWRPVVGYEDIYQVSEFGDVKLLIIRRGTQPVNRIMKPVFDKDGYKKVGLCNHDRKRKITPVHRIVALAFLGECPSVLQINHKDGDKLNNHYSNLEYISVGENLRHALKIGLRTPKKGTQKRSAKLREEYIPEIREKLANGITQSVIAKEYGVCRSLISNILRRKAWRHVK